MKLNLCGIKDSDAWRGYSLPAFDPETMMTKTRKEPIWLHMGAGNLFRALPARMHQHLLDTGLAEKGIIVCECYDEEIIPACYTPHDNLSLMVTLRADGGMDKHVTAVVAEAFNASAAPERLCEIFASPSLQMVSFTLTEKGYHVANASGEPIPSIVDELEKGPEGVRSAIGRATAGLLARYLAGGRPLAMVSMDNCAQNGAKLAQAVRFYGDAWCARGWVDNGFVEYINGDEVTFPWSMVDKITPRPSVAIAEKLESDGFKDTLIFETKKHTFTAAFVNAESCQYLVVEDAFPNGRPPLEKAGAIFTTRDTVEKTEKMKVCTCLNPLHTILGTAGCLLGYETIARTMEDQRLVNFINQTVYDESLPVVVNPGIIDPEAFLQEVITERFPNPYIPDTPERIVCDNSQKIPVRFGETLKARLAAHLTLDSLDAIPFFFALWMRYLLGVNDAGQPITVSPDPRFHELSGRLAGIELGQKGPFHDRLQPVLSDATLFGVDLYDEAVMLGQKVEEEFEKLIEGPGAVSRVLDKRYGG